MDIVTSINTFTSSWRLQNKEILKIIEITFFEGTTELDDYT